MFLDSLSLLLLLVNTEVIGQVFLVLPNRVRCKDAARKKLNQTRLGVVHTTHNLL